ncbi:MAG: hypothetical protein KJ767_01700 [Nanoarchaeota archaeon]|nr:hypothetical protein [Nanoarchaeota archaeon]
MPKKEKSLEELAESVREGITFPEFETLRDFETKALRIARKYDPDATIYTAPHSEGITIIVNKHQITVCERRRGHERIISKDVFDKAITKISDATRMPYN